MFDLAKELGAEITPEIAEALYVGLVTDTGRFMYENTTPRGAPDGGRADRAPASSPTGSTGACSRTCPSAASSCSSARSRSVERHDDGALTIAHLTADDFEVTGALETDSEGIVDHCAPSRAPPWPASCATSSGPSARAAR